MFLIKLDIVLPEDPATLLLGMYPKDAPMYNKDMCSTMFIAFFFIITRSRREQKMSFNNGMDTENLENSQNELLLSY